MLRRSTVFLVLLALASGPAFTQAIADGERTSSPNAMSVPTPVDSPDDAGLSKATSDELATDFLFKAARYPRDVRSIDGTGNNVRNPTWGSAGIPMLRLTTVSYANGRSTPAGGSRPSAREISNLCAAQERPIPNRDGLTDLLWQWGQFVDHDIDLTPTADPEEPFDIAVPAGDAFFDPTATGTATISLDRSAYSVVRRVRQQINAITAYVDASNVYGSDEERANALRTLDGTGRLKTSDGGLLPWNDAGLPNAPSDSASFFLAGDFRANEQVGLTAMHTLFVREHNTWADSIRDANPTLSGDEVYQRARAMVGAEMQAITYREFLPALLGPDALPPYRGYRGGVNAGIANVFATAAYRIGHTMLSGALPRLRRNGTSIPAGPLSLAEAFFNPGELVDRGIEPVLRGLASQPAQEIDLYLVDEVRNFLFGPPGAGGFDLASLNIQRGRDHGLPSYNQLREDYGLPRVRRFTDINPDRRIADRLAEAYGSVDEVDAWVGGLAERHVGGGVVGETFRAVLVDQFTRLRDGDRFWYQAYLPGNLVSMVEDQTLDRIIRRNTAIGGELNRNVFRMPPPPAQ